MNAYAGARGNRAAALPVPLSVRSPFSRRRGFVCGQRHGTRRGPAISTESSAKSTSKEQRFFLDPTYKPSDIANLSMCFLE